LRRLLVPVGEACAICHLSRPSSETCWVLVIGTQRKTKDRERCRCAGGGKSGVSGGRAVPYLGHDVLALAAPAGWRGPPGPDGMLSRRATGAGGPPGDLSLPENLSPRGDGRVAKSQQPSLC